MYNLQGFLWLLDLIHVDGLTINQNKLLIQIFWHSCRLSFMFTLMVPWGYRLSLSWQSMSQFHLNLTYQWLQYLRIIEQFSIECWKQFRICFGFALLVSMNNDWLAKFIPFSQLMGSQTKTSCAWPHVFSCVMLVTCICFEFWLADCAVYICCDWPEKLLSLVLVLQHSIENCSNYFYYNCANKWELSNEILYLFKYYSIFKHKFFLAWTPISY